MVRRPLGSGNNGALADRVPLLNYILGVGGQNAANARGLQPDTNRTEFLNTVSAAWANPRESEPVLVYAAGCHLWLPPWRPSCGTTEHRNS